MRLIEKRIKEKSWWKELAKKVSTVAVASAVTFGSIFGMTACESGNHVIEDENDTSMSESKQETEELKEIINSLNQIVTQLNDNKELQEKINEIEEKLAVVEKDNEDKDSVILELKELIASLKAEIVDLKEELKNLEESKQEVPNEDETNGENENPSEDKDKIDEDFAKIDAKFAIIDTFNCCYMNVSYDEGVNIITAPNGDVVGSRGMYNDYIYYNKDQQIAYTSNDGEQHFGVVTREQIEHLDFKTMCLKALDDETLVLDQNESETNKYVFKSEDGSSITIQIKYGEITSFENDYVQITKTNQDKFKKMLKNAKEHLRMIGLFDNYKKALNESLQYEYAEVLASSDTGETTMSGSGVFSGVNGATATTVSNGNMTYNIQTQEEQYSCVLDDDGNKIDEQYSEGEAVNVAQSFRNMCSKLSNGLFYTIAFDEETNKYTLISLNDDKVGSQIDICFNEDLSIDCVLNFENEVITYHISQISMEKYNEVFNNINDICQSAKEQDVTMNQ